MATGSLTSTCSASSVNTGGALHNTGIGTGGNHSIGPQPSPQGSQAQPHAQQPPAIRHKVRFISCTGADSKQETSEECFDSIFDLLS